ncbi:MAG: DUF6172 family protein [Syntrophotaleaceae bacterium]
MKKTFIFAHPESSGQGALKPIKHEVKKYIKQERNKKLPPNISFGTSTTGSVMMRPAVK